ncbi:unnamed protein product, partial [Amoebophrya sp. A25]
LLLGVAGSVAAVKLPDLLRKLQESGHVRSIEAVLSQSAEVFTLNPSVQYVGASVSQLLSDVATAPRSAEQEKLLKRVPVKVYTDADEWSEYAHVGVDPVLHIELVKRNDVFLIAPLSANTLAKLAGGLCDNLLTCCARAWPWT